MFNAVTGLLQNALITETNTTSDIGVYYLNKNEAIKLLNASGVQFPGGKNIADGFNHSIREPGSPVNPKLVNVTESKQYKKWFGKSKVVNPDGTPKVVYHGIDYKFSLFKAENNEYFFTDDINAARDYGEIQIPTYLSMENPYVIDLKGEGDAEIYDAIDYAKEVVGREHLRGVG